MVKLVKKIKLDLSNKQKKTYNNNLIVAQFVKHYVILPNIKLNKIKVLFLSYKNNDKYVCCGLFIFF